MAFIFNTYTKLLIAFCCYLIVLRKCRMRLYSSLVWFLGSLWFKFITLLQDSNKDIKFLTIVNRNIIPFPNGGCIIAIQSIHLYHKISRLFLCKMNIHIDNNTEAKEISLMQINFDSHTLGGEVSLDEEEKSKPRLTSSMDSPFGTFFCVLLSSSSINCSFKCFSSQSLPSRRAFNLSCCFWSHEGLSPLNLYSRKLNAL